MFTLRLSRPFRESKTDKDVALDPKHFFFLGGFGVIETQQMQHAVREQHIQFILQRVSGGLRLSFGDLGAQHHIAQQSGRCHEIIQIPMPLTKIT